MISPATAAFFARSLWAARLAPAQLERVAADATEGTFETGSTVCRQGDPAVHWIGVVEGMLKIETVSKTGRSNTFATVIAGSWLGEGAVLKGEPRPYGVIAQRRSAVCFIPRETFEWLIDASPAFSRFLIDQLNARLGHFIALVESFRLTEPTSRVAHCLAEFFDPQLFPATPSVLELSQEEVAKLSGLTRQKTNHALHELEDAGLLRRGYGSIVVLDKVGLQEFGKSH